MAEKLPEEPAEGRMTKRDYFTDQIDAMRRIPQCLDTSKGITVEVCLLLLQTLYNPLKAELDKMSSRADFMGQYEIKKIQTECNNAYNETKTLLELHKAVATKEKDNMSNTQNNYYGTVNNLQGATIQGDIVKGDKITHITNSNREPAPALPSEEQTAGAAPETPPSLTDEECIKKLKDTGFIVQNTRVKDRTVYIVRKGHTVLDVFDELEKITGSGLRARAIMIQNMTGVEATLNTHRPKHSLRT
jgi:predicted transcriptional regulator